VPAGVACCFGYPRRPERVRQSADRLERVAEHGDDALPLRTRRLAIISANVGELIAIGTYGTRDEAEVVQGLLASAGIEASIRADDAGGAFPFVLSGGAQVLVDESDATAASELLANRADPT
jgi:hypothetical protein